MRSAPGILLAMASLVLYACGGASESNKDDDSPPLQGTQLPEDHQKPSESEHSDSNTCGDSGPCDSGELCIATRGALCMPLPDEGETCSEGCVLTEHCCNCTAFSCTPLPETCEETSNCDCIAAAQEDGFLSLGCPSERSTCSSDTELELTCVLVDFDEDPFTE
jgi:hypothetical protein